jgi:hypothetical protein
MGTTEENRQETGDHALVIGIGHLDGFPSLPGAVTDARAFAEWLVQHLGGNLPSDNCHLLLSPEGAPDLGQDEIDTVLRRILDSVPGGSGRRFYFYFAGHGVVDDEGKVILCLGGPHSPQQLNGLDVEAYFDILAASGKFTEIVCFYDCCRESRSEVIGHCGLSPDLPPADAQPPRSFLAYACQFQDFAFEVERAPELVHTFLQGVFTRVLLTGLHGGAARQQGGVTAAALEDYLDLEVPPLANAQGEEQRPEVVNGLDPNAVFGSALPGAVEVEVRFTRDGTAVLAGPHLEELRRESVSAGSSWSLTLGNGLYELRYEGSPKEGRWFFAQAGGGVQHVEF